MPTHSDPEPGVASTILAVVEGDGLSVGLENGDSLLGEVTDVERTPPGTHLDALGMYEVAFETAGVAFELTMRYRERGDGQPAAESLDLRLVEGYDWSIPMTVGIDHISGR